MNSPTLSIVRLSSGYTRVSGGGPCNWGQYETWPPTDEEFARGTFSEASEPFRRAVRDEIRRLLSLITQKG